MTDPFTDFSVDRVVRLSLTRTYNSADYDLTSGLGGGVLGNGWHHDWEAYLTCTPDRICTAARGTLPGSQFQYSASQPSLDGSETWDIYLPHVVAPFKPPHHDVLVRRPTGEWIVFMSDGRELHFATAYTACDAVNGPYYKPPESGGLARLTKVIDASGNGVAVSYDPSHSVLLRLNDDLGHALEVRSAQSCASPAYATELRYDGALVAQYVVTGSNLARVTDASSRTMRSYVYGSTGSRLTAVQDEAGDPLAEFSYDATGAAIGVVDAQSSVAISYASDGWSSTVTEYFRGVAGDTNATHTRQLDYAGHVISISGGGSSGPAKNIAWAPGGRTGCTIDELGHVVYEDHDALGRVKYRLEYTGQTCAIPAALPADAREEWREYAVTRSIAQGVSLDLDEPTRVYRRSTLAPNAFAEEDSDYSQAPASIDPAGYTCASAALPAGSVACRRIESGYVIGKAGAQLEL